jgi:hypothetical protein
MVMGYLSSDHVVVVVAHALSTALTTKFEGNPFLRSVGVSLQSGHKASLLLLWGVMSLSSKLVSEDIDVVLLN